MIGIKLDLLPPMERANNNSQWSYEFKEILGEGASSCVYRAFRRCAGLDYNQEVAVKIINSEDGVGLLKNEIERLLPVRSSHIISVYGWDNIGGCPALITEFVSGVTLAKLLQSGQLEQGVIIEILSQAIIGLKDLSKYNIGHGDLNLQNIMVDTEGLVRLVDFGITCGTGARATPEFASDWVLQGNAPNFLSDLESLEKIYIYLCQAIGIKCVPEKLNAYHADTWASAEERVARLAEKVKQLQRIQKMTINKTKVIAAPRKSALRLNDVAVAALFICVLFIYGDVPASKLPVYTRIEVRTHRWVEVELEDGRKGYAPFFADIKAQKSFRLKWRTQTENGELILTPKDSGHIVLSDELFRGRHTGDYSRAD